MAKKLFYKIGEACKLLDVKPFVLRYWETEFPFLKPDKSRSGQRIYSERDLDIIRRINELLNVEGYTIAGARKKLLADLEAGSVPEQGAAAEPKAEGKATKKPELKSSVDTEARKKIKTLRSGIEEGLRQTRKILDMLGDASSSAEEDESHDSAA